ncbi:MAG TPA: hypothetical protein VHZ97_29400 [Pseudonocardiaceae bacterium]|nr:hypothetical protein [Pseudonocardiaceae bacterium]
MLDFDGGRLHGLLRLPAEPVHNAPAVIVGPGMEMIKEDYLLLLARRYYTSRGIVALPSKAQGKGNRLSTG